MSLLDIKIPPTGYGKRETGEGAGEILEQGRFEQRAGSREGEGGKVR